MDENQPAAVINAEMGTGKTMMAITAAAVMHEEGFTRTLVIVPPTWSTSGAGKSARPCPRPGSGSSTVRTPSGNCCSCGPCNGHPRSPSSSSWAGCACAWASTGNRPSSPASWWWGKAMSASGWPMRPVRSAVAC
ncbi:MAG TPA: hypothetical protein PKJ96_07200 [Thiobacillaceae bacterium]|nr:hypothetical protein [Thiobacillaceae bacterium]